MPRKKASNAENESATEVLEQELIEEESVSNDSEIDSTIENEGEKSVSEGSETDSSDIDEENDISEIENEMFEIDESAETEKVADTTEEDSSVYIMSNRMLQLFETAIYRHERLTGRISGVERTPKGVVANITYNGDSEGLLYDNVTVKIAAENMGLNNNAIEKYVRDRARVRGMRLDKDAFEIAKQRQQFGLLNRMLNAKVDFVPTSVEPSSKIVVGSRSAAMKQKRKSIIPTPSNPTPIIGVNSSVKARIIRVSPVYLVVEVSGVETTMRVSQISSMAVDLTEKFKVGDGIMVTVKKVSENGISVEARDFNLVDAKGKVQEYRRGTIALGEIYYYNARLGRYYIRMPNGCRGISYFERRLLHSNPRVGDSVRLLITGYTPSGTAVRCQIRGVL